MESIYDKMNYIDDEDSLNDNQSIMSDYGFEAGENDMNDLYYYKEDNEDVFVIVHGNDAASTIRYPQDGRSVKRPTSVTLSDNGDEVDLGTTTVEYELSTFGKYYVIADSNIDDKVWELLNNYLKSHANTNEALTKTKPSPQLLSVIDCLGITLNQLVKKEQDDEFANADTYTLVGSNNAVQSYENKLRNISANVINEVGNTDSYVRDYEIPENGTYVCVRVNKKGRSYLIIVDRRTMTEKLNEATDSDNVDTSSATQSKTQQLPDAKEVIKISKKELSKFSPSEAALMVIEHDIKFEIDELSTVTANDVRKRFGVRIPREAEDRARQIIRQMRDGNVHKGFIIGILPDKTTWLFKKDSWGFTAWKEITKMNNESIVTFIDEESDSN